MVILEFLSFFAFFTDKRYFLYETSCFSIKKHHENTDVGLFLLFFHENGTFFSFLFIY
jgi:hypothetical protein